MSLAAGGAVEGDEYLNYWQSAFVYRTISKYDKCSILRTSDTVQALWGRLVTAILSSRQFCMACLPF